MIMRQITWLSVWIATVGQAAGSGHDPARMERSYWLHASLGDRTLRGYWGRDMEGEPAPSEEEVRNAARVLCNDYAANRLYLIYHAEMPLEHACRVFRWWRDACPRAVDVVPTIVPRMYDKETTLVFAPDDLRRIVRFFRRDLGVSHVGLYDVYPDRDHREATAILEEEFKRRLVRVGIQPDEKISEAYAWVVQDTWSAFCHGRTEADWRSPGFGAETLRKWVSARNTAPCPVVYDLIVVAWDYTPTARGEYPGYDDAKKNMPLPMGRNRAGAGEILSLAQPGQLGGFSSDLFILQANSRTREHDGLEKSFYRTLKRGEMYGGYYAAPLREVVEIYRELRAGRLPSPTPVTTSAPATATAD